MPLNNINNIIKKQNKERGNSLEANNFQDTSKLINIETKDATEKEEDYSYEEEDDEEEESNNLYNYIKNIKLVLIAWEKNIILFNLIRK